MSERLLDKRWPWLVAAGLILAVFLSTVIEIGPPGDLDPRDTASPEAIASLRERDDVNVLFILVDTLRAERMGGYGYGRDTSPALDRLAASGVRFANHLAQSSWTKASMASLWTGLYPTRNGITRFDQVLPDSAELAAEIFERAGFRTAGIYRNGWVAPGFGFDQGFDAYLRPANQPPPPSVKRENPTLTDRGTDEGAITAALEFLRVYGKQRWFLYLHLMDVHEYLYDEESALFGGSHTDVYDNSIRHTDSVIQVLFDYLSAWGYRENTVIVVASDHGEAFGERGFDGHAREVYRETTEVPFILGLPFHIEPGIVVENRTANVDIWPTVFDLLGLEGFEQADGRSRVPEILAAARGEPLGDGDEQTIAHLDQTWSRPEVEPRQSVAVLEGPYRYVRYDRPNGQSLEHLFDRRDDPLEMRNRAEQDTETFTRLRDAAESYLAEEPVWGKPEVRELDELELNHLRALGYQVP